MPIPCVQIPPPLNAWLRRDRRASVEVQAAAGVRDPATATELAGVDVASDSHPVQVDGRDKREHLGGVAIDAYRAVGRVGECDRVQGDPHVSFDVQQRHVEAASVQRGCRAVRSLPGDGQRSGTDDPRRAHARASHDERLAVGCAVHCRREVRIRASRGWTRDRADLHALETCELRATGPEHGEHHNDEQTRTTRFAHHITPQSPMIRSNVRSCRAPLLCPSGREKGPPDQLERLQRQLPIAVPADRSTGGSTSPLRLPTGASPRRRCGPADINRGVTARPSSSRRW